jgi:ribosome-associated protein
VLCSGTSEPHLRAIRDEIVDELRTKHGVRPRAVDGTLQAGWVVIDYFDVIVHIMRADTRSRYDLEGLWGDATRLRSGTRRTSPAPRKTPARPRARLRRPSREADLGA